ncbi:MAG TPA: O-antigen ligase family protein [Blastocatellia bacterium]|nr:O-antigen ligase family protein [Blastocatellia bacterium]
MSSFGQTIGAQHNPLLTQRRARRALISRRIAATFICLLLALGLGASLALLMTLPGAWLMLSALAVCGLLGAGVWNWLRLPLVPVLRLALIFCFSFRLEINFFAERRTHAEPAGLNLSLALLLALTLVLVRQIGNRQQRERERIIPTGFALTFGALVIWCAISVLYGSEQMLGLYALLGVLTSGLICYTAAVCFSEREALRQAVLATALAVGGSGVIGLLQYQFGFATDWSILGAIAEDRVQKIADGDVSRVAGLLTMANAFGWYLVSFLPLLIAPLVLQLKSLRGWERLLLGGATGLGTVALILTYARGSWISFVFSMLALTLLAYRATMQTERRRYVWRVAGIAVLVLLMALPFAPLIYTRLTEDDRGAAESRLPLMEVAAGMIRDNPLLGVGLSAYETEMRRYDQTSEKITDDFDWPVHNIYLHIAAESGIPALILLFALIALALRRAWPVVQSRDQMLRALAVGLLAGLLAYLATGLKELGSLGSGQHRILFLLVGLMFAAARASERQEQPAAVKE